MEDDSAIADIYKTIMEKAGFDAEIFGLGREFLRGLKNAAEEGKNPAIVLLDLILPDMNGMEVLNKIKKDEETKDIKVFILTNQDESQIPKQDVKPDKFIVKANTTPTELVEIIKEELK